MQFSQTQSHTQLSLFEAFMAMPAEPVAPRESRRSSQDVFSELSLRGTAENCLNLLAPMLRELSEELDARWLTLVAPPAQLTQTWLRDMGLNRERILILQPGTRTATQLTVEALRLGNSHTVVSWLHPLPASARQQLVTAARSGNAQSLNIRLG